MKQQIFKEQEGISIDVWEKITLEKARQIIEQRKIKALL